MCKHTDIIRKAITDSGLTIVSLRPQGKGKHPSFMVTDGTIVRRCPFSKSPGDTRHVTRVYKTQLKRKFNLS